MAFSSTPCAHRNAPGQGNADSMRSSKCTWSRKCQIYGTILVLIKTILVHFTTNLTSRIYPSLLSVKLHSTPTMKITSPFLATVVFCLLSICSTVDAHRSLRASNGGRGGPKTKEAAPSKKGKRSCKDAKKMNKKGKVRVLEKSRYLIPCNHSLTLLCLFLNHRTAQSRPLFLLLEPPPMLLPIFPPMSPPMLPPWLPPLPRRQHPLSARK